ncbi:MAG: PAS domain S-box protein, partial [Gammaproteobacteria bacterium]|nr:PAS domain S-box protein [Gammaproteobacteria bacterium]
ADSWEAKALTQFKQKSDHIFQSFLDSEEKYFRYIGPIYIQPACLLCHGNEGAKVGDVRGGISVKVMARPIIESQRKSWQMMVLMHLVGFLVITMTSIFFMHQLRSHWRLLEQTQNELADKEQFLSDVTNSMSEGFVVLNPQGVVTYSNPESARLLGWGFAQIEGQKLVDLIYRDRRDEGFNLSQCAIILTLEDGLTRKEMDDQFLNKQGQWVPVALSVSPLLKDGQSNGVVVAVSDISQRKQADKERGRLERQLNQTHKMEAVGQLAGGIAHEINTPIQYVGDNLRFIKEAHEDISGLLDGYNKLLQKADGIEALKSQVKKVSEITEEVDLDYLKEEMPSAIDQSITGAEQVARIVLAMKEFAHPGSKEMELVDLNKIISNTVAVCKNEWKYVAETELQLAPDLPQV